MIPLIEKQEQKKRSRTPWLENSPTRSIQFAHKLETPRAMQAFYQEHRQMLPRIMQPLSHQPPMQDTRHAKQK